MLKSTIHNNKRKEIEIMSENTPSSVPYSPEGFALEIFKSRYAFDHDETWDQACHRVSQQVSYAEKDENTKKKWKDKFYEELSTNRFMPGGRIWHAAGRPKGNYLNCYVVPCEDSREGWTKAISDTTIITGMGGGVGLNFAPIRPHGEPIRGTGGVASGPCGLMHIINAAGDVIRASGGRRPALMMCLDVNHPDIVEFLDKKLDLKQLNNANVSIMIPPGKQDEFIKAIKNDEDWPLIWGNRVFATIKAKALWDRLITNALKSAEPGILNFDLANKMSNIWYYRPLISTNPCLTGDMRLLTADGYKTMRQLWVEGGYQEYDGKPDIDKHGKLMIINDRGAVPATNVYKTSDEAEIFRVTFNDGSYIDATASHRFVVIDEDGLEQKCELSELEEGDKIPVAPPGGFGHFHDPDYAIMAGWVIGDGSVATTRTGHQRAYLRFWDKDIELVAPNLKERLVRWYPDNTESTVQKTNWTDKSSASVAGFDNQRLDLQSGVLGRRLKEDGIVPGNKHQVPASVWLGDKETVASFLSGLFSADGSIQINESRKCISARLTQNSISLLRECQMLLSQFGIRSSVLKRRDANQQLMNDGKGGKKLYSRAVNHELLITNRAGVDLFIKDIGFIQESKNQSAIKWLAEHPGSNNSTPRKCNIVKSIEQIESQETFCLTEMEMHRIAVGTSLTLNCGEIGLEAYGACDLGALVLPRFVTNSGTMDWELLAHTIATGVRFLDNVIDVSVYPVVESDEEMKHVRRLGLGVMGLHHMLLLMGMKYDSKEALQFVDELFKFIRNRAYETSCFLAAEKGVFPKYDAEKFIQSGFIKTLSSGVREKVRMYGVRNCALMTIAPTGTTSIVSDVSSGIEPIYALAYERRYRDGEEMKIEMVYDSMFKRFADEGRDTSVLQSTHDLSVRSHLEMQKICQKYIDNAVSKTINIPADHNFDEISNLILEYIPYLKGVTVYVDGSRGESPLSGAKSLEDALKSYGCRSGVCEL